MTGKPGHCGNRPWPPTSREVEHDPTCLHDAPGPGGHVCDVGCEAYIEWVESYWEGFDAAAERMVEMIREANAPLLDRPHWTERIYAAIGMRPR